MGSMAMTVVSGRSMRWLNRSNCPSSPRPGMLVRSLQVCAALDAAVALAVEHTGSRVQFGRPLAKFQAVQNLVACRRRAD